MMTIGTCGPVSEDHIDREKRKTVGRRRATGIVINIGLGPCKMIKRAVTTTGLGNTDIEPHLVKNEMQKTDLVAQTRIDAIEEDDTPHPAH